MKNSANNFKSLLTAIFCALVITALSQPDGWQWKNPYLQGNDLNSIVMNGSVGWAVGALGTVMKTTNEGFDWEIVSLGTTENLNSIYMNEMTGDGWIVGYNGTIFYTGDGGESWSKQRSGTDEVLFSVTAIEGSCPWICGHNVILKSHMKGEPWEWVNCPFQSYFFSISQKDCDEVWVSGQQGLVISTADEGATWSSHSTGVNQNLYSIDIVAEGDYRVCGYGGNILKSSDAGITWIKEFDQTFLYLNSVDTRGIGGPAYAVGGDGTILETYDGGSTWIKKESGVFTYLNDVCFQAIMHGVYATGWYGIILRKEEPVDAEFEIMNERPIHFMEGVDFVNASMGWAVGWKEIDDATVEGVILNTTDGGENWNVQKTLPDGLMAVDFINENEGWAVGNNGAIKHTTNGGQGWSTQTSPMTGLLTSVFFIDENNGWITNRDNWGEICHTTNGGNTWALQAEYSPNPMNDIFFITPEMGWAVGMDTTVMRTLDGGQNWVNCDVDVYGNPYLRSVQFIDENTGWAVGTGSAILKSTDGGVSWHEIDTEFHELLQSVYFTDKNNGWAVGDAGTILRTIDGGENWFALYSGVERGFLASVCFTDTLNGWVAGEGGTIKRTWNGGFWNEPGVFQKKYLNKPIADLSETKDTVVVQVMQTRESGYELVGLEVMLDTIWHSRVSDLQITLAHNNVDVTIVNQATGGGANFLWTRLKDEATKQFADGAAPFSGNYKPSTALYNFNGMDPDGEWILTVYDGQAGNTGSLKAWGIKPLFDRKVGINEPLPDVKPANIVLFQNQPNPFSSNTRISWSSRISGFTTVCIFDVNGREITTLMSKYLQKGDYSVEFDGSGLSPGVYYYRLQVDDAVVVRKCVIL